MSTTSAPFPLPTLISAETRSPPPPQPPSALSFHFFEGEILKTSILSRFLFLPSGHPGVPNIQQPLTVPRPPGKDKPAQLKEGNTGLGPLWCKVPQGSPGSPNPSRRSHNPTARTEDVAEHHRPCRSATKKPRGAEKGTGTCWGGSALLISAEPCLHLLLR